MADRDMLLALVAFVALLVDPIFEHDPSAITPLAALLALATSLPLTVRRRYPLGVLAVVVPLVLVCLAVFHPSRAAVGVVMLLVFTVGLEGGRSRSLVVGGLMAPVVAGAVLLTGRQGTAADVIAFSSLVLGALLAGEALRARQALARTIADDAARQRVALAQHRFDEERLGWAHELHDIVGHTLVAINVRAAAAAHAGRRRESPDADAFQEIADVSAEALADLRATLKGLRTTHDAPALLHPLQELADLPDLVAGVQGTHLKIDIDMPAVPPPMSATVGHAAYRIVQESLTNVLRHSTAGWAQVRVCVEADALAVEVLDDGGPRAIDAATGGHGLQGMQERAVGLGGTCEAGPLPGAGWRVRAVLPRDGGVE